jgi:SAM-dependent methyltransferase
MTVATPAAVGWHEAECGAYEGDLAAWSELASSTAGPVLELGCGTGRVAAMLAARGREVVAVDLDADLLAALPDGVDGVRADALSLGLGREFGLITAPMSFANLLGSAALADLLATIARHLDPHGLAGVSLLDPERIEAAVWPEDAGLMPAPDEARIDGVLYTSLPVRTALEDGWITVVRERRAEDGQRLLASETATIALELIGRDEFEAAAVVAGLSVVRWLEVPASAEHVASLIAVLEVDS